MWFGGILRYQPPKLSWRRRQHDAFHSPVFWFNVIFPTTLTFPGNLYCSRPAVVRLVHPVNPQAASCSTSWGTSRVRTKCNGITIKNDFQYYSTSPRIIATRHHCETNQLCRFSPWKVVKHYKQKHTQHVRRRLR